MFGADRDILPPAGDCKVNASFHHWLAGGKLLKVVTVVGDGRGARVVRLDDL